MDGLRGEDHAQDREDGQDECQGPEDAIGEAPEFFAGLLGHVAGENGDEGGGHGPFADQSAEEVRDAVGDDKGVGPGGGAEQEGEALVADIAQDTADDGNQGDDGGRFKDVLFFGQAGVAPGLSH